MYVRQLLTTTPDPTRPDLVRVRIISRGPWHEIRSPGWLVGFVLPHPGIVYEFSQEPPASD